MNVVLEIKQFNINDVYYQEPVKNTIMDNSNFIRAIYSNSLFMLNGIFIRFNLNVVAIEKSFNKYKCVFDKHYNTHEAITISTIERDLLSKINIPGKHPIYRISEQLANGHVKIFIDNTTIKRSTNEFILKISGIWENEMEYGVTYKFTEGNLGSL